MYDHKVGRQPKCSHYVSLSNHRIYPAMRNVPGFEDDNPIDWRPATADEVQMYKNGEQPKFAPAGAPVQLDAPAPAAAPSTIQLADEDPAEPETPPLPPPGFVPTPPAFNPPQ